MSMPLLAERAGLGTATVWRALRGQSKPRAATLGAMSAAMACDATGEPRGTAAAAREQQAQEKAAKLVSVAIGSAALEADFVAPAPAGVERMVETVAESLLAGPNLRLWG